MTGQAGTPPPGDRTARGVGAGAGRADGAVRARKRREAALALPLLGAVALMPPVAELFAVEGLVAGVPVPVAYITAVWAALILGAALLARRLRREGEEAEDRAGARDPHGPAPPGGGEPRC